RRPSFVALAYDEPATGENHAQTERFRKILDSILHGRINRSQLTPALSKQYTDAVLKGLASDFQGLGGLEGVAFKGESGSPKARVYKYLLRFGQANVLATFTLDSSDRFESLDFTES
ncbi:MAG: hypothetical protein WAK84_09510, partial [Candidatus Cybelea sp.]